MRGEEERAELSTDDEVEVGGAVTVDNDPEEEEEVDLGMGAVAAAAGVAGTSGESVPTGLSGAVDSWVESPVGAAGVFRAAGVFNAPSGRTAVPGNEIINRQ